MTDTGAVLILALWTLALLSVFALHLGFRVQKKIQVLSRLEHKPKLHSIAEAGIKKARAVFYKKDDPAKKMAEIKQTRFNNPDDFQEQKIGQEIFEVSYLNYDMGAGSPRKMYGIEDEERKININKADKTMLERLIRNVTDLDKSDANTLAKTIIDWREYGRSDIVGFFSDEYYDNLEFPYGEKKTDFEILDELLLIKGMDEEIYNKLKDFMTVYGDGRININTASRPVLKALGLSDSLVNKIFVARRGADLLEATLDDAALLEYRSISAKLPENLKLKRNELDVLEILFHHGILGAQSAFFKIRSLARLYNTNKNKVIVCVFNSRNNKIVYWQENEITLEEK
jgi:type II secretory pathway component PulK